MLSLRAKNVTLVANDLEAAILMAENMPGYFERLGAAPVAPWPPAPLDAETVLPWVRESLEADRDGEGWYGWALVAEAGEAPRRIIGVAALIGRPDFDGEVELGFTFVPGVRDPDLAKDAVRALSEWALQQGAGRVITHLAMDDDQRAATLAQTGFRDTRDPPYPGVARWALELF